MYTKQENCPTLERGEGFRDTSFRRQFAQRSDDWADPGEEGKGVGHRGLLCGGAEAGVGDLKGRRSLKRAPFSEQGPQT